jgi:hypothetical protein
MNHKQIGTSERNLFVHMLISSTFTTEPEKYMTFQSS